MFLKAATTVNLNGYLKKYNFLDSQYFVVSSILIWESYYFVSKALKESIIIQRNTKKVQK